ncbi:MAG: IclR family transcriptional regulator [bacterium]|nr:IclR family transcriptional regulator [bacterium]
MTDNERIPTNLRTLLILEILGKSDVAMTPTEINRELGLPKQTVHRLCTTLVEEGFLVKLPQGKKLQPSRRLRMMASGILHNASLHIARHQILQDVARQVGETVNCVVVEEQGMIYRDRVETDWAFRIQLPIGTHVPFHCTASGKTYLASLPPKARLVMVKSLKLEKLTPKTHSEVESLMLELEEIAAQGYAIDDEEFFKGMVAIAVPVVDPAGRFLGALAFHGPTQRLSIESTKDKLDVLHDGAKRLADAFMCLTSAPIERD